MWTIPNILTLLRILLIPVFVLIFYLPFEGARVLSAAVFALASVTDWLDGYLARRWQQVSPFGAFLDPVADKLMVAAALLLLVEAEPSPALALAAAIIVGREITISALREWMAEIGARAQVAVSMIGKFKTAVQMVAILLLIIKQPLWEIPVFTVGFVLLYVSAILTLWSMVVYLRAAWPSLSGQSVVEVLPREK
ncbi:CDP-diacylglycerol--glycerol-3-phosphate 3-phosphatidyltransferase [endosymbiont of Ridgeia piscesae]|uniref:CDP-diacylglycerol--glycerol-3-phosphate 3-phosphatidyltransferase n=1 Tax=endosymbiont of Ridgeia piscesae TaxID=54398 RepID=A0A0T5YY52_9GAMM|nr:CDP-diacylglycerol--glycerol-3-phosphate 3-phosphatidyltransferase [endosymbiont of Ridgeia piscesae]KRT55538.1 CDP-diacylglycerol--glycerol-3-phosphate 3-phosphatidyltransferase [endosymbiont of Ridgeia piscesae]